MTYSTAEQGSHYELDPISDSCGMLPRNVFANLWQSGPKMTLGGQSHEKYPSSSIHQFGPIAECYTTPKCHIVHLV